MDISREKILQSINRNLKIYLIKIYQIPRINLCADSGYQDKKSIEVLNMLIIFKRRH